MNEVQNYVVKPRIASRGPLVDTELCTRQVGNARFDLVIIAAERLREMRKQNKHSDKYITPVEALLDIQAGLVNPQEYLEKIRDRHAREKEKVSHGY
jgi:DNA-directed RNA polymerase subunit K/omega